MHPPRARIQIILFTLFLLAGCAAVFGVRAYLDYRHGGKKPPHIGIYVLKNGIMPSNEETRSYRNVKLSLNSPLGGMAGYEYTFPEVLARQGISAGYVEFLRQDDHATFPTNQTPKSIHLLIKGYRDAMVDLNPEDPLQQALSAKPSPTSSTKWSAKARPTTSSGSSGRRKAAISSGPYPPYLISNRRGDSSPSTETKIEFRSIFTHFTFTALGFSGTVIV
jgi:hypothetical protein